jgi:hypothetical protein
MFDLKTMTANMDSWEIPEVPTQGVPKWMTEDYPGMEMDIAKDLYSVVFWSEHAKAVKDAVDGGRPAPDPQEMLVRSREMSTALMSTVVHARNKSEAFDRAFAFLAWKVKQTGAYHFSEYESVMEFLVDAGISDKGGELNDIKFLLEDFFPMLTSMKMDGWSVEDVLAIKDNWSRTRAAIPFIRHAADELVATTNGLDKQLQEKKVEREKLETKLDDLDAEGLKDTPDYEDTSKKFEEKVDEIDSLALKIPAEKEKAQKKFNDTFAEILNVIPDISVKPWSSNPLDKTVKSVLMKTADLTLYNGQMTAIPGGSIFLAIVPSKMERAIQSALQNMIEFHITDPEVMRSEIQLAVKSSPYKE